MERLRLITQFWNWLPAFRAIGETSHLPSAAEALHLSPSALSRALQQLERSLGRKLFRRANRRLHLTREGERFLAVVRDAMRMVHEATLAVQNRPLEGTLRVFSAGVATSAWVLPALIDLHARIPSLVPELVTDLTDLAPRMLSGQLDIAFSSRRISHARLCTEQLGFAHAGIYCGPEHPLYRQREVSLEDVLAGEFVAPPPDESGTHVDGWPVTLPRHIVVEVDRMRLGCEVCRNTKLLAVLPDLVADEVGRGELRRLPLEIIPSAPIHATLRPPIGQTTAAEVLLEEVKKRVGEGRNR